MDSRVDKGDSKGSVKMGASSNTDSTKYATLLERKKLIQEKLDKHHKELKKLCIDEAELTGVLPVEYPFEQGELPPTFRRRVGTAFQLNQTLLNNMNNAEEISELEVEMQLVAKMAQAALGLSNESTSNKAAKKAHYADYEQHMQRYKDLENKMHDLKISSLSHTFANNQQKQKKKPRPEQEQDSVSMNVNFSDPFAKPLRHSMRSLQYQSSQTCIKPRPASQRYYHVPEPTLNAPNAQLVRQEPTFYKLSLDGYKQYEEKQESLNVAVNEGHFRSYLNYPNMSRTLPHASRRSPQAHNQYLEKSSPNSYAPQSVSTMRLSSPGTSSSVKYYPLAVQGQQRQYYPDPRTPTNPLQLQPHQQYEQNVMTSGGSGLGGYWKQSEGGEYWCNAPSESMKDKRFGSLDRRKNKRLQKKLLHAESKLATLIAAPGTIYPDATRTLPTKSQAIAVRRHENRQLVRTQSLGSVGAITIDSTCPSDDSSCGSENVNYDASLARKNIKQKEWYETSLDGPPAAAVISRAPSTVPSIAPEDKYVETPPTTPTNPPPMNFTPQGTPKEIPAESNPSPRIPETNIEIFNNNIPKNCTVVQQAQWKPYHEETKPFEMSDFYKYSTKFKKKPVEDNGGLVSPTSSTGSGRSVGFRNLPTNVHAQASNGNRNSDVSNLSSSSLESSHLHIADNFSAEMNAWYQKHEHPSDNNNATLV